MVLVLGVSTSWVRGEETFREELHALLYDFTKSTEGMAGT